MRVISVFYYNSAKNVYCQITPQAMMNVNIQKPSSAGLCAGSLSAGSGRGLSCASNIMFKIEVVVEKKGK
jgi:hypothetical protein